MTPPRRRSLLAYFILLFTLIGVPASYSHVPETVFGVMVALGVFVVFLCLGLGLVNADAASELEKMLRGEGILARWTVPPDEWLEFQKRQPELRKQAEYPTLQLNFTGKPPASGVEVVFTEDRVFVCNVPNTLVMGWGVPTSLHPSWIEWEIDQEDGLVILRIPFPPSARAEAERLVSLFNAAQAKVKAVAKAEARAKAKAEVKAKAEAKAKTKRQA